MPSAGSLMLREFLEYTNEKYVDNGNLFKGFDKQTLSSGATQYYTIRASSRGLRFASFGIASQVGDLDIETFTESSLSSIGTTSISKSNYNIGSTNTPDTEIYSDPSVSTEGTLEDRDYIPGQESFKTLSGGTLARDDFGRIPGSEEILIKLTNNSTGTGDVLTKFLWKEGDSS